MYRLAVVLAVIPVLLCTNHACADTFGSGANTFDIDFVTIGNPGNAADTTGNPNPAGKVDYTYRMGQFEISEGMIDNANKLDRVGITHDNRGANKPVTDVSWCEAARFVNWLNTDSGSTPAYKFIGITFELWTPGDAGYDPNNLYRNSLAKYFLPSVDEWYKAAYYDPNNAVYYDYPTGSDMAPTPVASGTALHTAVYDQPFPTGPADITLAGGLSPYGTMGQGGNVYEWEETDNDLVNDSTSSFRDLRGGGWNNNTFGLTALERSNADPAVSVPVFGFRVASTIPEPTTFTLTAFALCLVATRRRRAKQGG